MHPSRIALVLLLTGGLASAQAPAPKAAMDKAPSTGQVLDRQLANLEREFVPAAEAMPEATFAFTPGSGGFKGEFKTVKTFAEQVRHVASANYMFAAGILGEKAPADLGGENGPEALKTKAEIVKYLKDSFAYAHKALAGITDANATTSIPSPWGKGTATRLGLATLTVSHGFDHYGQMAVYLRMNGIIPPASRQ
ncbi:DinB family protein [Geothrix limicola]|nr:DinB family protein [Geothrix limicola]